MDNKSINSDVNIWTKESIKLLQQQFTVLDIKHSSRSRSPVAARDILKSVIAYRQGLASRIGFKFPRHMVFVAKGVGNGIPAALAGTSATTRKQKDWFNVVIDPQVEKLADNLANKQADLIVNGLRIR